MRVLGMTHFSTDDLDEAMASCRYGPVGAALEVLDRETGKWLGPGCWEEIEYHEARLFLRRPELSPHIVLGYN